MSVNDFKPFAISAGAYVLDQTSWLSDASLPYGFPSGILTKERLNKALRQPSAVSAAIAQLVSNRLGQDVLDNGNMATLINQLDTAFPSSGGSGSSAQGIDLSATAGAFVFDNASATSTTSPTITFTAYLQNVTGTVTFTAVAKDAGGTTLGTVPLGGSSPNATMTGAQFLTFPATRHVLVTASIPGTLSTLVDTFTIIRLDNGSDSLDARLTNETASITALADGTITSYSGAAGTMEAYKGTVRLGSGTVPSVSFSLAGYTGFATVYPAAQAGITVNATTGAYAVTAGVNADNSTVTIRATLSTGQTIDAVFSMSKSKAGVAGANGTAPILNLTATDQVFAIPANSSTPVPTNITLTAAVANIPSPTYVWKVDGATQAGATTSVFNLASFTSGRKVVRCDATGSDSSTAYDQLTVYVVKDGDNAINAGLSNENQTISCDSSGAPLVSGSGLPITSQIVVVRGATVITNPTVTYNFVSSTGFSGLSLSASGAITITGITADVASAVYAVTVGGVTYPAGTLTANKSKNGANGTGAPGNNGRSAVNAYALYTGNPIPSGVSVVTSGSTLPATNAWGFATAATAFSLTTQTPGTGQSQFMTQGTFDPVANTTTWVVPFLAHFKAGTLGALVADLGSVQISNGGSLWSGKNTSTSTAAPGFFLGMESGVPKFTIGNGPLTKAMLWDGTDLKFNVTAGDGLKFFNTASGAPVAIGSLAAQTVPGTSTPAMTLGGPTAGGPVAFSSTSSFGTALATMWALPFTNDSVFTVYRAAPGGKATFSGVGGDVYLTATNINGEAGGTADLHLQANNGLSAGTLFIDTANVVLNGLNSEFKLQASVATGGQLRLKTGAGSTGRGAILRNDGDSFFIMGTANGDADGTWTTDRPFRYQFSSGIVTIQNLALTGMTVGTGLASATFSGLKPGAASTNSWLTLNINGTTWQVPAWPN